LLLWVATPVFAGNLVLNATGGTLTVGSDFTLTGATTSNPAGTLTFDCPITSITGTYTVDYACTGGSFTFTSNDGSTTVSGVFASANVYETASGGGKGNPTKYSYQFFGPFSGTETVNGVSAAINGEATLSLGGLTYQLGSATAGSSAARHHLGLHADLHQ
jgi:hypothetical protein